MEFFLRIIKNSVVPANRRGLSVGLNSPVEDSPFVLSPHIPDSVILLSEALFCDSRPLFLRLELSRGKDLSLILLISDTWDLVSMVS